MPQAFFKNGSVIWAGLTAWLSVTRLVIWIPPPLDAAANPPIAQQQTPSRMIAPQQRRLGMQIMGCISSPRYAITSARMNNRPRGALQRFCPQGKGDKEL